MKLLKKLLPAVTIASTAAVVAPLVTSCGIATIDMTKEYNPTIDPYKPTDAEASGVTKDAAKKLYLEKAAGNSNIVVQDVYYTTTRTQIEMYEGQKATIGVKVNKIDKEKELVNFEVTQHSSYNFKGSVEGVEANIDLDLSMWYKVENAKFDIEWINWVTFGEGWCPSIGVVFSSYLAWSELGDQVITGKMTGHLHSTIAGVELMKRDCTGKQFTIKKDSTLPTDENEAEEFVEILQAGAHTRYFSHYFKNLKSK